MTTPPTRSYTPVLSAMMFLQFFLWGAWFVPLGPFMGALGMKPTDIGNAYTTAPIAAILAPLILGMIADRFFASQVVMGVLHVVGGGLLLLAPRFATGESPNATLFTAVLLAHMLCYMPTLGLSNTIAFNAMRDPQKQFPIVRVWGTIGWIVAGITVGLIAKKLVPEMETEKATEAARNASPHFFTVAGVSGILLGLFSFALPHTPPPLKGKPFSAASALGLDALSLLKERAFLVFALSSMLVCIPLAAYYSFAGEYARVSGVTNVPFKMSFGQMSEIFFMLVMPLFFARLGVKWMLAVGMLAWVARYALFGAAWNPAAAHATWMVLAGIILHGICYDFFFVTGQIYTEQKAPPQIRAQAQGFLVLLTQGVGMLIGNQLFGRLVEHYTTGTGDAKVTDWRTVWFIPAGFAFAILIAFLIAFPKQRATTAHAPNPA
ncbi:MAG TPA: nucleoside permease [Phycisphaerales bacterium]|nr:nucleoside permease [Phycisphaerales bacterium]